MIFSIPAGGMLYDNLEVVNQCLRGLEERVDALKKQEKGKIEFYQAQVDKMNAILKPLYTDSHVFFGKPKPYTFIWNKKTSNPNVQIYDRGLTASKVCFLFF